MKYTDQIQIKDLIYYELLKHTFFLSVVLNPSCNQNITLRVNYETLG